MLPIVLMLAAALVRLAYLGEPQLGRDEAASWYLASQPLGTMLRLSSHETFPPLYLLLLKGWIALFGDNEAALRSLSVVFGVGTVIVTWRWARDVTDGFGGAVAGCLAMLSPALVLASRNTRMYALETLVAVSAWWLTWLLIASGSGWTPRRRRAALLVLVVMVAAEVWTMAVGIPVAGLQLAFALISALWLRSRVAISVAVSILLGAASITPWLPNLFGLAVNGQAFWTPTPNASSILNTVAGWFVGDIGTTFPESAVLAAIAAAMVLLACAGLVASWSGTPTDETRDGSLSGTDVSNARRRRSSVLAIVLAVGLVPGLWIYSQFRSIYDPRYLDASFPPLAIAVAASMVAILPKSAERGPLPRAMRRLSAGVAVVAIVSGMTFGMAGAVDRWRSDTQLDPGRQMAQTLSTLVRPGDVVITLNAQSYFPLRYYFVRSGDADRLGVRVYDWHRPSAAFFTGWRDIDEPEILNASKIQASGWVGATHLARDGSLWLVTLVDPGYEFPLFDPLQTGELQQIRTIDVGSTGQLRQAVPRSS